LLLASYTVCIVFNGRKQEKHCPIDVKNKTTMDPNGFRSILILFIVTTLDTDNVLIFLGPPLSNRSIASSWIGDMGPHQLNDPVAILLGLHLPNDLL
jgi:hypothetical protein